MARVSTRKWYFVLAIALAPVSPAGALTTTGDVTQVAPPPSLELDAFVSNTTIWLIEEAGVVLATDLAVDLTLPGTYNDPAQITPGIIPAGTVVRSYITHFDSIDTQLVLNRSGSITFDTDILGVMILDATLDASDPVVGLASVVYPTGLVFRGTEISTQFPESVSLVDNRTFRIDRIGVDLVSDSLRIITIVPEPGTASLLAIGLSLLALHGRRRDPPVREKAILGVQQHSAIAGQ
jgi:hypothetical protein